MGGAAEGRRDDASIARFAKRQRWRLRSRPAEAAVLAAGGQQYTVNMVNMAYGPVPGSLKVGDSIVFVNKDSVPHTVTAREP